MRGGGCEAEGCEVVLMRGEVRVRARVNRTISTMCRRLSIVGSIMSFSSTRELFFSFLGQTKSRVAALTLTRRMISSTRIFALLAC